jgi:hypothetical protein
MLLWESEIIDSLRSLEELKNVMERMHGGKYRWNWKKYKIAMRNLGCKCICPNCRARFSLDLYRDHGSYRYGDRENPCQEFRILVDWPEERHDIG